uniref:CCT domain-containing protein n=1 Tax=Leersia perrieri TaxID=77586 RepID=A0A0D9WSS3_9ORYZ
MAPAAVTCKADAAVLCAACDADIHDANPLARRHARVPVAPIGSAAAAAVAAEAMLFGIGAGAGDDAEAEEEKAAVDLNVEAKDNMKLDYLFSDLDPYLFPRFPHADSVVPNGGAAPAAIELDFTCGLGAAKQSYSSYTATDLAHSGSSSEVGVVPEAICIGIGGGGIDLDFTRPKPQHQPYMTSYTANPPTHAQVSSVEVGLVPERATPAMGEGREARLMRYREKRKNRRFEKTIRYASRKAYAETRPRIKGRFAKRTDHDADADDGEPDADEASVPGSSYMLDFGYGVVPSF